MGEVKLIGAIPSLFCTRIEWALKLKGVEYEYLEEENIRNKSPTLLKFNPVHKKVPVLVHHGKPIAESLVILEYIDETWTDSPLLPEDPLERASHRMWAKFADEKCVSGAWLACKAEGEEREKAIVAVREALTLLEKQIQGKKFFGGEQLGFLDLAVGSIPHSYNALEQVGGFKFFDAEMFPFLHEWMENFIQIPLVSECLPHRDKLVNYFSGSLSYVRSLTTKE